MERLLSLPRSVLGALAVLLALNLLGWSIVAYSGKKRASLAQTWQYERNGYLDRQAFLENQSGELEEKLKAETGAVDALKLEVGEQQAVMADLEERLEAQLTASGDLDFLNAETEAVAEEKAAFAAELDDYRQRINQARSVLSGRTATIAAREREIERLEEQLSVLGDLAALRATMSAEAKAGDDQRAALAAELGDYRQRINQARSVLSGRTATVVARERDIARAEARLAELEHDISLSSAALRDLNATIAKRDRVERDLAELESRLSALRGEHATKLAVIGSLASKVERQRDNASQELMAREQAITTLQSDFAVAEQELNDDLAELQDKVGQKRQGTGIHQCRFGHPFERACRCREPARRVAR